MLSDSLHHYFIEIIVHDGRHRNTMVPFYHELFDVCQTF
jgi:hypothetical protein